MLLQKLSKIMKKRAIVKNVDVKSVRDGLGYDITIVFAVKGSDKASNFYDFFRNKSRIIYGISIKLEINWIRFR